MTIGPGTQVAQYRVDRRLGRGGMGEVFLARDTRLDRPVAIKFLHAPSDVQARHRLMREARAVAALDHPGICAVYEVGSDPDAGDFIAMQYVEGDTLAARLQRGRLRPDEALSIGGHVADALMAAHRHGIIHRDLKPQNIVLTASGTPKLLDFGLAMYVANSPAAANAATMLNVSDSAANGGTPAYMSPEQVREEPADYRSDVFSLGAVLYECLTGQCVFAGANTAQTLANVLHMDPPPVSSHFPDLSPAYDALCQRLLHKRPEERFQSAEEVLGAIRALTPSASSHGHVAPARSRSRVSRTTMAALVGIAALAVAVSQFWPRGSGLPIAPPDALHWYDIGVDAMRDGTYVAAVSAFGEAIKLFPQYPQAYSRQAEALIALDDERRARAALLEVAKLVPDRSRLPEEERLRFDAASAAALRQRDAAVRAYQQLADLQPNEAGRWLDVGRAEETANRLPNATSAYTKAVALDAQSAAGRLRLGILQVRTGKTADGLASMDEAIRLYQAASKAEGESEALLRKGIALATLGQPDAAQQLFNQVLALATENRFPAQRLGAQMGLAKLAYVAGKATDAEALAQRAVADAKAANLPTLAAAGLIDLGFYLVGMSLHDRADAQLEEAVRLAAERGATRVEMRAKATQASLRVQRSEHEEALRLAAEPAKYFKEAGETRNAADVALVQSRAHQSLGHFEEADALAREVLTFAESSRDDVRKAGALESLAGSLALAGRLPGALAERERIDALHRAQNDQSSLPRDLTNHAELLIVLGRGREADALLREVEKGITSGIPSYAERRKRVAFLRALLSATERRWADVGPAVAIAVADAKSGADSRLAAILGEFALSALGRSRRAPDVIASWPSEGPTAASRREWSYWVARTLLNRGEWALATRVSTTALADPMLENHEIAWRLAAVAAEAARRGPSPAGRTAFATQARSNIDHINASWAEAARAYFLRPDLVALFNAVQQ